MVVAWFRRTLSSRPTTGGSGGGGAPHPRRRRFLPAVEALEDRCVLSRGVDVILEWNAVTLEANRVDHTPALGGQLQQRGPTRTARAFAIVHGAMYDAFNAVDHSGRPFLVNAPRVLAQGASGEAAVAAAALRTLSALYPAQRATFEAAFRRTLARIPNGQFENWGVALGAFVANRYLALRRNDGSQVADPYVPPGNAPGVFQTFPGEPAALDPNWGGVTPFGLLSGDQFRAPAPPALTSQAYADAYNEVRLLGAADAETADRDGNGLPDRTAEQTRIGIYWGYDGTPGLGTPPRLYNQIARAIARQEGNSERENARLFALINVAMADAGIAAWETKYVYDVWRPIRGIRQVGSDGSALDDGNPLTEAEAGWTPLGAPTGPGGIDFTPPFPAYTSGHATFGAALFETIRQFYGRDDISFTFTSDEFNGVTRGSNGLVRPLSPRTFDTLSEAEFENAQSRIYLGVHWGFDRDEGLAQGRGVADFIFERYFLPSGNGPGSPRSSGATRSSSSASAAAALASSSAQPEAGALALIYSPTPTGPNQPAQRKGVATEPTAATPPVVLSGVGVDPVAARGQAQDGVSLRSLLQRCAAEADAGLADPAFASLLVAGWPASPK